MRDIKEFKKNHDYKDVYFLVIDASEHSKIVRSNDSDKVDTAFDEFEKVVKEAVDSNVQQSRVEIAEFWGWRGDGGLIVFYDNEESRARKTALSSAKDILARMPYLNFQWESLDVSGEIHVRIALHKGSLKHKGVERIGSIHSKELNLAHHVEKIVPSDTIAVSQDIYDISGDAKNEFFKAPGDFENTGFFLYSSRARNEIEKEWKEKLTALGEKIVFGLDSDISIGELGMSGIYSQRALTPEYFQLVKDSKRCIWALGIGLHGFQTNHRKSVLLRKAQDGIDIRFLVCDPSVKVLLNDRPLTLPSWRDYAMGGGDYCSKSLDSIVQIVRSINKELREQKPTNDNLIKLRFYNTIPTFAMLNIDSEVFFSPYFVQQPSLKSFTAKFRAEGFLGNQCIRHFVSIWQDARYSTDASAARA